MVDTFFGKPFLEKSSIAHIDITLEKKLYFCDCFQRRETVLLVSVTRRWIPHTTQAVTSLWSILLVTDTSSLWESWCHSLLVRPWAYSDELPLKRPFYNQSVTIVLKIQSNFKIYPLCRLQSKLCTWLNNVNYFPDSASCADYCQNGGQCSISPEDGVSCNCTGTGYVGYQCSGAFKKSV